MHQKLIVGLGNPGLRYANNRHNVGFICLNHFAKAHSIKFDRKACHARIGTGEVASSSVVLARPQIFMIQSGRSVSQLVKRFEVTLNELIVMHDDLDLPLGKIRIRLGGSSAGHKGINSIIEALGNPNFIRIRVGIGRPELTEGHEETRQDEVVDYVLGAFTPEERKIMEETIPRVSQAIVTILTEDVTTAMNKYN